ncbi:PAS domain-containing protein [bacterium]|nr:MAG: PAS domain-containing protein [bacterium]
MDKMISEPETSGGVRAPSFLLADEDRKWTAALSELLSGRGFLVEVANDGFTALELAKNTFDAVLLGSFVSKVESDTIIRCLRDREKPLEARIFLLSSDPHCINPYITSMSDAVIAKAPPGDTFSLVVKAWERCVNEGAIPSGEGLLVCREGWEPRADSKKVEALKRRLSCVYGALPGMVFEIDNSGKVVYANDKALETLRRRISGVIGLQINECLELPEESRLDRALNSARLNPAFPPLEFPFELRGRIYKVLITALPVMEDAHDIILTMTDATERYIARRDFLRSNLELEQLFQGSGGAICVIDNDCVITRVNENFVELIGYPRQEMIGAKCFNIFPGPDCDTGLCSIDMARKGKVAKNREVVRKNYRKDDVVCLLTTSPLHHSDGKFAGIIKDFRDITDRKKEIALAEAKSVSEHLSHAFSGIRHEIGNQVNSSKMAINVLRNNLASFDEATVKEYLERALGELSRAENLFRSLKSFGTFEVTRPKKGNLRSFLTDFGQTLKEECKSKDIAFTLGMEEEVKSCNFDSRGLTQVLSNLYSNSLGALAKREAPRIELKATAGKDEVIITFSDNGGGVCGIEEKNLFKPFFSTKTGVPGLGLAISRKLMASMNGTIDLISSEGEGVTVRLKLPRE